MDEINSSRAHDMFRAIRPPTSPDALEANAMQTKTAHFERKSNSKKYGETKWRLILRNPPTTEPSCPTRSSQQSCFLFNP